MNPETDVTNEMTAAEASAQEFSAVPGQGNDSLHHVTRKCSFPPRMFDWVFYFGWHYKVISLNFVVSAEHVIYLQMKVTSTKQLSEEELRTLLLEKVRRMVLY